MFHVKNYVKFNKLYLSRYETVEESYGNAVQSDQIKNMCEYSPFG